MAYEEVEMLVTGKRAGLPASASLTGNRSGRPTFKVVLQKHFIADEFPIKDGENFALLLGTAEQKGLLRLVRDKAGILTAHIGSKGGATFNCGHIARFGDESAAKEFCKAHVIDASTVEIVLPAWEE